MEEDHKILVGLSGQRYRYDFIQDDDDRKPVEGTYAVVALVGGVLASVILVAQSTNVLFTARAVLPPNVHMYKATHVLYHINHDAKARAEEVADLIAAYDPVGNRQR